MYRATAPCRATLLPALIVVAVVSAGGCADTQPVYPTSYIQPATQPALTAGLHPPQAMKTLHTLSPVPEGWKADPAKHSSDHDHQAWLSPTGRTAYGVITFHSWLLPLASDRMVLDKFLQNMKKSEGEAKLLAMKQDPTMRGLRFVAEGGLYTVRGNLVTEGSRGWVIYAGTLRQHPVEEDELKLAERAREQTVLGLARPTDSRGKSDE